MLASLSTHVGKIIDRIDVPEFLAILAITPVVYEVINVEYPSFRREQFVIGTTLAEETEDLRLSISKTEMGQKILPFLPKEDWQVWLLAYGISYIIIKHGGQIAMAIGTSFAGIVNLVKMFLPIAAVIP